MERKRSEKKILEFKDLIKPFTCSLKEGNTDLHGFGRVLALQINGEKRVFPLNEKIELDPVSYQHIMDMRFNGRDFVVKGSYDELTFD